VALVASGSARGEQTIHNDQLGLRVDTNDEWIRSRTGIRERCICGPQQSLADLSHQAGDAALTMAGWSPESVDLVLLATSTPDDLFGTAPKVQALLGARQADQLSRWVDWDDRRTCVLFGDAAGAVALEVTTPAQDGLLGFALRSDGRRGDCLNLSQHQERQALVAGTSHQVGGFAPISMNGQEVYKFAVREVPAILHHLLQSTETAADCLDWLLLHQANQRILDAVADRFNLPHAKVLSNLAHYGNTSAATIPLMLDEAVRDGRIQPGHRIASSGFGAGLSWGAALFRWQGPS
jgi:3-oxoacyl-[acyl-carrier-protein] synthase-3